jgi:hypothetical protein
MTGEIFFKSPKQSFFLGFCLFLQVFGENSKTIMLNYSRYSLIMANFDSHFFPTGPARMKIQLKLFKMSLH